MKRFFTYSGILKTLLIGAVFSGIYSPSQAQKTAMTFQTTPTWQSYNADVVIDGTIPAIPLAWWPYTSGDIDTAFSYTDLGSSLPPARWSLVSTNTFGPTAIPNAGGNLTSINTNYGPPPVYNLAPTNTKNVMHLRNTMVDTFIFQNQTLIGDIYLLGAASGEPSGTNVNGANGSATVTFLFTDGTTQAVSNVIFPNYRDSSSALNVAKSNIGRYRMIPTAMGSTVDGDNGRPRLFDIRVPLPYAQYGKRIKGVRIAKTSSGVDHQLNIFGVCIDNNPCLPTTLVNAPASTPAPATKITYTNPVTWNAVAGSAGYDVMLEAYPNQAAQFQAVTVANSNIPVFPSAAAVQVVNGGSATTFTPGMPGSTLIPNMVYVLFVRSKCSSPTGASVWYPISFKTPNCQTPVGVAEQPGTKTTRSLSFWWRKTGSVTITPPASPTHIQFEYGLAPDATTPPTTTTVGATPPNDTSVRYPGLQTDRPYTLWVRNNCTGTSWSDWFKLSSFTSQCPPVTGLSQITGTNVPTAITLSWNRITDSALTTYQYQVVLNSAPNPDYSNWSLTTDTFVNLTGLNPGQQYRFLVRSYCNDTGSRSIANSIFINPFYPCDTPGTPVVTNINMNGAQIDWARGGSPAPYPILTYNVAVTVNATPPTTFATPAQAPPLHLIFRTTDTFFHPGAFGTLAPNTQYFVHVRTECDSVYRAPSQTNQQLIYNWSSPWKTTSFRTIDTCVPPIIPNIANITEHGMDADWNLYYGIIGYEYYIDQQPNDPMSPPPTWPLISFNKVMPRNLFSNTNYWFHLRTKCNATTYSPWTNTPFRTLAQCAGQTTAPALQATPGNPGATSAIFNWAAVPNATAYDCAVTTGPTPPAVPDATVSINTYTAQALTPNTSYYFHLKANCSPNDVTSWSTIPFKTDYPTSVGTLENGVSVLVYPNPTNDDVTVDIQNNPKGTIQVLDVTGKVIYSTETTDQKTIINMKPFASGVYTIKYYVDAANTQMIRVQKI